MDRRAFIGTVAGSLLAAPFAAEAQPAGKVPVVGILNSGFTGQSTAIAAFRSGLLETDPVAGGFAASLARPGANVTGLFLDHPGLTGKWLELIREANPKVHRIALLWDATTGPWQLAAAKTAARDLGMDVQVLEVRSSDDFDAALRGGLRDLIQLSSPLVDRNSKRTGDFTLKNRIVAISMFRTFAEGGGLMSYGPNRPQYDRRLAGYIEKLLRGAKPADLPVEQPTTFELVINLKTAKALGLTIPPSLLERADQVIE